MEIFILRLTELAFQVAGLEQAERVRAAIQPGTNRLCKANLWIWFARLLRMQWIVVGHTVYMTGHFFFVYVHEPGGLDISYTRMLRRIREHERHGTVGAWRRRLWLSVKKRFLGK